MILEADVFCVTEGSIRTTISPNLRSWNIAASSGAWQGGVSPAGSKTVAWYQTEIMGTREAQCALHILGVCAIKPINGKIPQMAYWESDQPIVPMKQGNACGGKGLTVEPLGQGHIHRTQMRVKDGNKTVPITYPPKKKGGWGGSSEEPDEGNLHVRFCEGTHSNLGAITPTRGAL
jgi:hypothetical protein